MFRKKKWQRELRKHNIRKGRCKTPLSFLRKAAGTGCFSRSAGGVCVPGLCALRSYGMYRTQARDADHPMKSSIGTETEVKKSLRNS